MPGIPIYSRLGSGTLRIAPYYRERVYSHRAIENLKEAAESEAEFDLTDILEQVTHQTVKRVVEENIRFVLKREKLISDETTFPPSLFRERQVVIPEGAYDYSLSGDEISDLGRFGGNFEIFLDNRVAAYGNVVGTIAFDPPELLDISVQITEVTD